MTEARTPVSKLIEAQSEGVCVMSKEKEYWFPAKRYGWGWGLPSSWQGWVVLVVYFSLLGLGVLVLLTDPEPYYVFAFVAFTGLLSVLLIAICRLKGEPPKWRWGKR